MPQLPNILSSVPAITSYTGPISGYGGAMSQGVNNPSHLWAAGLNSPIVNAILQWMYPQYFTTTMFDVLNGRKEGIPGTTWDWYVMGKTRVKTVVNSVDAGIGTAVITVTTTNPLDLGINNGARLRVGDVIRTSTGAHGRIETITANPSPVGNEQLTIRKVYKDANPVVLADATWLATDISPTPGAASLLGQITTAFAEGSGMPEGGSYIPTKRSGQLQILKKSLRITGNQLLQGDYFNFAAGMGLMNEDGSEYSALVHMNLMIKYAEMKRDKENLIMFGVGNIENAVPGTIQYSDGIFPTLLNAGSVEDFVGPMTIDDIDAAINRVRLESSTPELVILGGLYYCADFQRALQPEFIVDFSRPEFKALKQIGINITEYFYRGTTLYLVEYEPFNDDDVLTYVATTPIAGATANFRNTAVWLNMGASNTGNPLLSMKYQEMGDISREQWTDVFMGSIGAIGSNGQSNALMSKLAWQKPGMAPTHSGDYIDYTCSANIGIQVDFPNRHLIHRNQAV